MASTGRWQAFGKTAGKIDLQLTFQNGQCFGWSATGGGTSPMAEFTGVLSGGYVVSLRPPSVSASSAARPPSSGLQFICRHLPAGQTGDEVPRLLADLFQLDVDMQPLVKTWTDADARMKAIATALPGMRILRQDPFPCLLSFIISSNNNIPRITKILDSLRVTYGDRLCEYGGKCWHSFPSIDSLAAAPDAELRALGTGYRARFIRETCQRLQEVGGHDYLESLRSKPRDEVQAELMKFCGVGRKVADCVALFSLDQHSVVPVDTHVASIAARDFDASLSVTNLNATVYDRIGELFRGRYGEYAGWAHSLLFAAELPALRDRLPAEIVKDIARSAAEEKAAKARARSRSGGKAKGGGGGNSSKPPTKEGKGKAKDKDKDTDKKKGKNATGRRPAGGGGAGAGAGAGVGTTRHRSSTKQTRQDTVSTDDNTITGMRTRSTSKRQRHT